MRFRTATAALYFALTLGLATQAHAQASPFSYRGLYEGTLTDSTKAYFFVSSDGHGQFAWLDEANLAVHSNSFPIAPDGSFNFQASKFTPDQTGGPFETNAVTVSGTFFGSSVAGAIDALQFNIPRTQLSRDSTSPIGLSSGWVDTHGGGQPVHDIQTVFTPGGNFYALVTKSSINQGQYPTQAFVGTYSSNGDITARQINGGLNVTGNLQVSQGIVSGTLFSWHILAHKENVDHRLANISTRGNVGGGANVMIAGFIVENGAKRVLIRALGPTIGALGVPGILPNPSIELHSATALIATNDDWQVGNDVAAINATTYAPSFPAESALLVTLEEGAYTIVVSGVGGTTGVALVDVYEID